MHLPFCGMDLNWHCAYERKGKKLDIILFVCTGNTCRSAMAEGIWNAMARKSGVEVRAVSSGLVAFSGDPAAPQAVEAAKAYGADLTGHRARRLTLYDLEEAKAVYCMTRQQEETLCRLVPDLAEKITCLDERDITDPFGGSIALYRQTAQQIGDAIARRMAQEERRP